MPEYLKLKERKPLEADITRQIRGYLRGIGVMHYKQWQGMGSLPGVSDIIGCWYGRYFAIEVKRPGCNPSDKQRAFMDWVNDNGGLAFVARSVQDVMERMK